MKLHISLIGRNTVGMAVFLLLFGWLSAQGGFTIYNTGNSGIPNNSVNALHLASDGKLWVGTDFGLASFDGSNWVVYQAGSSGLPNNSVRSIAEDDSGAVWAGTFGAGLAKHDGLSWTVWDPGNSNLPGEHVRCLAADAAGGMWIGTTSGLARLRGGVMDTWDFLSQGSESNNVAAIAMQDSETVWLGMVNGGLIRLSDTGFADYTINNSAITDNTILGIALDADDPWLATPANGVTYYWNLVFLAYHPLNSNNPSFSYTAIDIDPSGEIWLGSIDKGVVYYDRQDWRYFDMTNSPMPQNQIRSVVYDAVRDAVWVGTASEGLVRMDRALVLDAGSISVGDGLLQVYPQPCVGEMVLHFDGPKAFAFRLLDEQGRVVMSGTVQPGGTVVGLEGVAAGMYLLEWAGARRRVAVR